jgi:hypothetical protein
MNSKDAEAGGKSRRYLARADDGWPTWLLFATDTMIDIDISQLPAEMTALLLRRGSGAPPLFWPSTANRIAKTTLDQVVDAKLFGRKELAKPAFGGATRALIYLWNGWPREASMCAQVAPDKERFYIEGLCARQESNVDQAKASFQQLDDHVVYKPLSQRAVKAVGNTPDPILTRFIQMIEMGGTWEPFLFIDLFEQGRADKLKESTELIVRQIQNTEFELLFRHCYENATGQSLQKIVARSSMTDREEGVARVRRLQERHRPKRRAPGGATTEKTKSETSESSDMVTVKCPKCAKPMTLPDAARGQKKRCIKCNAPFNVPARKDDGGAGAYAPTGTFTLRCPKCSCTLKAPEAARGKTERCGKCGTAFMIPKKPAPGGVGAGK